MEVETSMGSNEHPFFAAWTPRVLSILRIVTGLLFFTHGSQKLFGFPPPDHPMVLTPWTLPWTAGILELVGGAMILLGLLTRPAAFVLCGEMAVAYFMAHAPHAFWPIVNKGEPAVLYCFLFLFFAFSGAGAFSIDALFNRARNEAPRVTPGVSPQLRPR